MEAVQLKHVFLVFPLHEKHLFMCLQCHCGILAFSMLMYILLIHVVYQDT